MKLLSDSYLYRTTDYNKRIFEYLMTSERIDKSSDNFGDIIYDVKKQANSILLKVLLSDKVVLLIDQKGISRQFKVLYVKDIKEKKEKKKVFIDCTDLITVSDDGFYKCKNVGKLVSYLISAMVYILYYNNPSSIITNSTVVKTGTAAFVDLMLYVLSYLKIPVTYADNKEKMSFVLAEYFQYSVLGSESDENIFNIAKNISGITDKKTCDYLHTLFSFTLGDGKADIAKFLNKFAEYFLDQKEDAATPKNRSLLTVDSLVQRWMYAYGPGTFLGLECFVPFSQILTDCYSGAFINQQNTIEKVVTGKTVTSFTNELLRIGSENA